MRIDYAPGAAWAVIRGARLLVLPAAAAPAEAVAAYDALEAGPTAEAIAQSPADFGSPLAVFIADAHGQLLRRSGVPAAVDGDALARRAASTLEVDTVAGASLAVGQLDLLDADVLPAADGVIRVSAVRVALAGSTDGAAPFSAETAAPGGLQAAHPIADPAPSPEPEPAP
ncbi:MAG: hypothetical protein ACTH1N_09545, partial [Agrococcus casei]